MKRGILSFILVLFFCTSAGAATIYVSPTGSGSTCSKASPCAIDGITWTDLNSADSTIYFFGGTYTTNFSVSGRSSPTGTLYLKPCSASPDPSGCDTQVIFQGSGADQSLILGLANNTVVDGETTSGAGTRNIKFDLNGWHFGMEIGNVSNVGIKYTEITGALKDPNVSSLYVINGPGVGSNIEIAYNYIHDNWAHSDIRMYPTTNDAYGKIKIHHNQMAKGTWNYIMGGGGMDIYNNVFDVTAATEPYDVIHYYDTAALQYLRVFNNHFDSYEQMIFLENASTTQCSGGPCPTQHVRIHNNVFTCTVPTYLDPGNVFFGGRPIIIENSDAAGTVDDFIIVNNTFVNTQYAVDLSGHEGTPSTYTNFKFVNNICYENSAHAGYDVSSCVGYDRLVTWANEGDAVFDHNLLYDNDTLRTSWLDDDLSAMKAYTSLSTFVTDHPTYNGNVNDDPHFTSSTDFTLTSASHARGAGLDASAYTNMDSLSLWPRDKNGTLRSAWDIGAYEYDPGKKITIGAGGTVTFGAGGTITLGN